MSGRATVIIAAGRLDPQKRADLVTGIAVQRRARNGARLVAEHQVKVQITQLRMHNSVGVLGAIHAP